MKTLCTVLGSILFGLFLWNSFLRPHTKEATATQLNASWGEFHQKIADATMQILIYPQSGELHERGLGSLVQISRETMILTHAHWDYLADIAKALIVNSENQLLVELSGSEFQNLIRYRDRGTLILSAPAELQGRSAELGDGMDLQVGFLVDIVQRNSVERYQVDVVRAKVISLDSYNGLPVIRYRIIDGEEIRPGDSGGGLWYRGELMGNTWGMYVDESRRLLAGGEIIQTSIAAQFPFNFLGIAERSKGLPISETDERTESFKYRP